MQSRPWIGIEPRTCCWHVVYIYLDRYEKMAYRKHDTLYTIQEPVCEFARSFSEKTAMLYPCKLDWLAVSLTFQSTSLGWPIFKSVCFWSCEVRLCSNRVKPITLMLLFTMWRTSRQVYLWRWERYAAGYPHLGVTDTWLATPKRAHYSALIAFS